MPSSHSDSPILTDIDETDRRLLCLLQTEA
ncbi:MAG: hypothetical protein ACI9MD_002119, partial [Psychrobacter glaciei]